MRPVPPKCDGHRPPLHSKRTAPAERGLGIPPHRGPAPSTPTGMGRGTHPSLIPPREAQSD